MVAEWKETVCKFCKSVFLKNPKAVRRNHCYRPECESRQKKESRSDSARRNRIYRRQRRYIVQRKEQNKSPKMEVRRLWEDKQPLIRCLSCGEMKPGPFEICFDCREVKREQIDTDWIYQAEGSRWRGAEV